MKSSPWAERKKEYNNHTSDRSIDRFNDQIDQSNNLLHNFRLTQLVQLPDSSFNHPGPNFLSLSCVSPHRKSLIRAFSNLLIDLEIKIYIQKFFLREISIDRNFFDAKKVKNEQFFH
jgi:hypothetical protein